MIDLSVLNPMSKYFLKGKPDQQAVDDIQTNKNAVGSSEQDIINSFNYGMYDYDGQPGSVMTAPVNFSGMFINKKDKIIQYRRMERYPEIADALDMIADDSIIKDTDGNIVHLNFKKEINRRKRAAIQAEFDNVVNNVLRVQDRLWDWYRKYLVEGEIFLELVLSNDAKEIVGVKPLASFNTFPIYKGDVIVQFVQNDGDIDSSRHDKVFPPQQVAYTNWGKYGNDKMDVRGYLDPAIRPYNQLRNLEDAVVIYRIVRAPERRLWNIEVGKMPTGKADEYIKKMIHKYKKQINYNSETGTIDSSAMVQSLSNDIWMAKKEGQGSSVDTLPGGQALGELEDLKYFATKLQKSLKVPKNRLEDYTTQYNSGRNVEREEVRFGKFVDRSTHRFSKVIMDVFIQQLRIKGYEEEFLNRKLYGIEFTKSMFFQDFKEQELIEQKINTWGNISSYVVSVDDPNQPFSRDWAALNLAQFTQEEWDENKQMLAKEKAVIDKTIEKEGLDEEE